VTRGFLRLLGVCTLAAALTGCTYVPLPDAAETSSAPSPQHGSPLDGRVIVIDAGHNGGNAEHPEVIGEQVDVANGKKECDTTGTETDDGYPEHEFTFDVAQRLATELKSLGAQVVATRDSDDGVGPCITERAEIGNDAPGDAAVSVHADGGPSDGRGFHVMEPSLLKGHTDEIVGPSHELALAIRDAYAQDMPPADYIGTDGINPRDDMGGLNLSTVPKVMLECGNMRNSQDAELLKDKTFRQRTAEAIAAGITDFLTED
jgi:N-acetylmuramoyl-L-alanine amidase